jgi:hypothetical protein
MVARIGEALWLESEACRPWRTAHRGSGRTIRLANVRSVWSWARPGSIIWEQRAVRGRGSTPARTVPIPWR